MLMKNRVQGDVLHDRHLPHQWKEESDKMKYLAWALLGLALIAGGVGFSVWAFSSNHWGYALIAINGVWTGAVMIRNGWGNYKLQQVIDRLDRVIQDDPKAAAAYFDRAQAYWMRQKRLLAIADLKRCIEASEDPRLTKTAKEALAAIEQ